MIDRFVARVGRLGAILIVVLAVVLIGLGGGVVEHFRLASQNEQQGEQAGQAGEQGNHESGQADEGQSQENDNASGARQQGQQSD
jgi:uncharacterized protein HemX